MRRRNRVSHSEIREVSRPPTEVRPPAVHRTGDMPQKSYCKQTSRNSQPNTMKSNAEWKQWGATDPLYAVATWEDRSKTGSKPWTDSEFYQLGASDWADFWPHWQHFGCSLGHCIEIGCGAGRLTKQLGSIFQRVTGLDVSPDQIAYARTRVTLANVTFTETNGLQFPASVHDVTAAFSTHVFQHFDDFSDAAAVFAEIARVLVPGGSLMIHLPIYDLPDIRFRGVLKRIIAFNHRRNRAIAARERRKGKPLMRGLKFDREWIVATLEHLGFHRIEFRTIRVRSNGAWHPFVLAQKKP